MSNIIFELQVKDSVLVDEITSMIQDFITEVNDIYRTTTFDGGHTGYNFRVDRVAVSMIIYMDIDMDTISMKC